MDESHIQHVLGGDIQEFRYLVIKYKDRAFNLAKSILKSDLTAEEAVQDAFIQAFRNLHKFEHKSAFSTWFYRIVVNVALRKNKKKQMEYIQVDELSLKDTISSLRIEAIEHLHEEEQREIINEVLDNMKDNESLLLKLYYLEEKKIEEIAEITGFTDSNCKVILHRARKSFAEIYRKRIN
jgi:RNA polymerase sigma factor (sigma-70 family)